MGARKIVDDGEVVRWFAEGRTYEWMTSEYLRKYNIEVVPSIWGNFRRSRGLPRRITRDDDLIPWAVRREHRWKYPLAMLRVEARRRAGRPLRQVDQERLESWTQHLASKGVVVAYDPDTSAGFSDVPREDDDTDMIRRPRRKTTQRATTE